MRMPLLLLQLKNSVLFSFHNEALLFIWQCLFLCKIAPICVKPLSLGTRLESEKNLKSTNRRIAVKNFYSVVYVFSVKQYIKRCGDLGIN